MNKATVLGLTILILIAFSAALGAEEDEQRVVFRGRHPCPDIRILGSSGEPIRIGRSNRGFLGVELTRLTPELRRHFGLPGDAGVMVARVIEDSAAAAAGLAVGDIITRVDGEEILAPNGLGRAVRQKSGGDRVEIEYWRGGEVDTTNAELEEHERCAFDLGDYLHDIDLGELAGEGLAISEEALETLRDVDWEDAFHGLQTIDWEKHFEGLEGLKALDLERIEERMERVQERLRRLEKDLEHEQEQRRERIERDRAQGEGADA